MSDIAYLCSSLHVRLNHYFKSVIHAEHCTDAEKDLPLDKEQADDVIESFRQLATRSVRNHTAMLHPADRRIVSQLTQKIEALTRNISAAREVINTQTLQLEDQQNRIKEASSANDRMARTIEQQKLFSGILHEDIAKLKSIVGKVRDSFQQTRTELLVARTDQCALVSTLKQQVVEVERLKRNAAKMDSSMQEKDNLTLKKTEEINIIKSQMAVLQSNFDNARQTDHTHKADASEAQRMVLELHTRVVEIQSKYQSAMEMVSFQEKSILGIASDNKKLIALYEEAARIRDENSFCYLNTVPKLDEKPIQGSCNDSTIEQAAEKTNKIDKNINVEKRYSSGALNVMDKSRCGKRKQIDDSIPLNNDLVDLCGICDKKPYGLMVHCNSCNRDFHSGCVKRSGSMRQKDGATTNRFHTTDAYVCQMCSAC